MRIRPFPNMSDLRCDRQQPILLTDDDEFSEI